MGPGDLAAHKHFRALVFGLSHLQCPSSLAAPGAAESDRQTLEVRVGLSGRAILRGHSDAPEFYLRSGVLDAPADLVMVSVTNVGRPHRYSLGYLLAAIPLEETRICLDPPPQRSHFPITLGAVSLFTTAGQLQGWKRISERPLDMRCQVSWVRYDCGSCGYAWPPQQEMCFARDRRRSCASFLESSRREVPPIEAQVQINGEAQGGPWGGGLVVDTQVPTRFPK